MPSHRAWFMLVAGALALAAAPAVAQAPVVTLAAPADPVIAGQAVTLDAAATDPAGGALSFTWLALAGTVAPAGASATWTAPEAAGDVTVRVTATSSASGLSADAQVTVPVILAGYQAALAVPLVAPRQVRAGPAGELYVVDRQTGGAGAVLILTPRGELRAVADVAEPALAVTYGNGHLWVATERGSLFKVDPETGASLGAVALADGPFTRPVAIAFDAARLTLWVADGAADRVRVVRPDGETVAVITAMGTVPLRGPLDVAIDPDAARAWVLGSGARPATTSGQPLAAVRLVHGFSLDGAYQTSIVGQGTTATTVTRAAGLAVGPDGRVYVSDSYQSRVQVFRADGLPLGPIGAFGEAAGQIMNPAALAFLANGDLAVASPTLGRIERFGSGAPLPTCGDDTDCDGLPDAWELAHGLNPEWAGDAAVDTDGDGLSNAEEYALGTDPREADTDGDGYGDRDELLAGFDPLDPDDHNPVLVASAPRASDPGLVQVNAVLSGPGGCAVAWRQVSGPPVALRGASTLAPSFVAREAATYVVEGVARCGRASTQPVQVAVAVRNVAPRAEAGRVIVVSPGATFALDALASADANGGPLAFVWDQTLGPAILASTADPTPVVRPRGAGLYAFQLTATDHAGVASTAEVPVLVAPSGAAPTALARSAPSAPQVGDTVVLDATASVVPEDGGFSWSQVAGPAVVLDGDTRAVATFTPPRAGRYAFEVAVGGARLRSPAARVEVFVAEAGAPLPRALATAEELAAVDAPVLLDGRASTGAGLAWAWRQTAGPAAGLTGADRAVATVVPFEPGFYVFELVVREGAAESRPARVAFEARRDGQPIPLARVVALPSGEAHPNDVVVLDGRASERATRWRWTQRAGPWVPLEDAGEPVASLRPHAAGEYVFELEVDDGTVRSAPARVRVRVAPEVAR